MIKYVEAEILSFSELRSFLNASCPSANRFAFDRNNFTYVGSTSVELAFKNLLRFLGGTVPNIHEIDDLQVRLYMLLDYLGLDECMRLLLNMRIDLDVDYCMSLNHATVRYDFHSYSNSAHVTEEAFSTIIDTLYSIRRSLEDLVKYSGFSTFKSGAAAKFNLVTNALELLTANEILKRKPEIRSRGLNFNRMLQVATAYHNKTYW